MRRIRRPQTERFGLEPLRFAVGAEYRAARGLRRHARLRALRRTHRHVEKALRLTARLRLSRGRRLRLGRRCAAGAAAAVLGPQEARILGPLEQRTEILADGPEVFRPDGERAALRLDDELVAEKPRQMIGAAGDERL